MTYALDIELSDPLEAAIDDIIYEVEEAIENIRKFRPHRVTHTEEVDIDELLAEYQAIGIVWDIQHVVDRGLEWSHFCALAWGQIELPADPDLQPPL